VGEWVPASAREHLDEETNQKVDKLLDKKYGLMKKMFGFSLSKKKQKYTVLEITERK